MIRILPYRAGAAAMTAALVIGSCVTGARGQNVQRGESAGDRFVHCVEQAVGRPVYADASVRHLLPLDGVCGGARDLDKVLERHRLGLMQGGRGEPVYLYPLRLVSGEVPDLQVRWKTLKVDVKVATLDGDAGTRPIPKAKYPLIQRELLQRARRSPVAPPIRANEGGDVARIEYELRLTQHRVRNDGPELVFAFMGQVSGPTRLAVGRLHGDAYSLRWDSPVFSGALLRWTFEDLDGDGRDEIVIVSVVNRSDALVVFDAEGKELTRQQDPQVDSLWTAEGSVSAIGGVEFQFTPAPAGKSQDIRVRRFDQDTEFEVYRLTNGSYRRVER